MWFAIILALYVLGLVFIWGFFIIARVHVYKFKQYSTHIVAATKLVFFILLALTVIGFIVVVQEYSGSTTPSKTVKEAAVSETY